MCDEIEFDHPLIGQSFGFGHDRLDRAAALGTSECRNNAKCTAVRTAFSDLEVGLHVFGLSVAQSGRWSVMDCVSIMVSQDGGQTAFPEVTVEQQSDGSVTLAAASDTQVSWALVSDPAGASTQLDGIGDNGTRLEYRSNANGTHLFSATLANGLSDWVAVELENTP